MTYSFQYHLERTRENFRCWQKSDFATYGRPQAQTTAQQGRLGDLHDPVQAQGLA